MAAASTTTKKNEREIHRMVSGFPIEIHFAMYRLLKRKGVKHKEVHEEGFMGMLFNATSYTKITKGKEVHTGISGKFELAAKNPWEINRIEMTDNRKDVVFKFLTNEGWKIDQFVLDLQTELAAEQVLQGSTFSIDRQGLEFFKPSIEKPIFSQSLEDAITYSIYAPIKYHIEIPQFRRGVLLSGTYGTGKSSVAAYTAQLAKDNNITFVYLKDPRKFKGAIQYFSAMGKVVLFVEDIDRLFEGERDETIDVMLNTLDGIDTKSEDIMFIFTTNNLQVIERALLRPGRIDSIIEMELPNADAAKQIIARYAAPYLPTQDITNALASELVTHMAGTSYPPAVLREIVSRSVFAMKSTNRTQLTLDDLIRATRSIESQVQLINTPPIRKENTFNDAFAQAFKVWRTKY